MTEFFSLPSIDIKDFETTRTIQYWFEHTDYAEFNKIYDNKMDKFIEFCVENGVELKEGMDIYYRRQKELQLKAKKL